WRFGLGQGLVGTAAMTGRPIIADDVGEDPRYINATREVRSEIVLPLIAKNRTIGVLDIGGAEPSFFSESDQRLLGFLADHLANAIESARLYENMSEQARTLSLLHEVCRELTSILDRRQLVRRLADMIKRLIEYDVFTVLLWNEQTQQLEPTMAICSGGPGIESVRSMPLGVGITGTAAALRQPLRVPNVHLEPRYVTCVEDLDVKSELAVPMVFKDRLIGVLDLESGSYDAFQAKDQQLLSTLASSLAIALENARLYEKLQEEEQRLEQDLETAREVQKQLLPTSTPWVADLEIGVAYEPARHLGGDFYDFLPYGEGRVGLVLGDVAGKATSAALLGSLAVGVLREYTAAHQDLEPGVVLSEMNKKLGRLGFSSRFVALGFAVFDAARRRLTLANSGLPHPYLLRGRQLRKIEVGGVPLGLLPKQSYEQATIDLQPGDAVVLVSDGIEESHDAAENEFGRERLESTLQRLARGSAREIADGLLDAAQLHAGDAETYDDRTIVVIKATG
ncbi:MAG: SpoIIE family protein phosphatase, partial [Thermoanaerobaculia bacterium]|nr:SpoIIE family protein phosphatase [Thermoanaerobaculia bacterium]